MSKNMKWSTKKKNQIIDLHAYERWSNDQQQMFEACADHSAQPWTDRPTVIDHLATEDQRWQDSPRGSSASFKIIGDHQRSSVSFNIISHHQQASTSSQSQCAHRPHYQQWSAQSYWASTVIKMTMLKHETHLRGWVNISLVGMMPERYISQTSLNLRITHNNLGPIFMLGLPTTPSAIISMCMSKYSNADHDDKVNKVLIMMTMFRYHSAWHQFSLHGWVTSGWSTYVGYFTTSSHLWIKNNDQAISLSW